MPSTPEQDVSLVRLNIADLDPEQPVLTDEQVEALLVQANGSVNRASARALRIIAASEVLIGKVIRTQELSTSGDRVAEALRKLAADYDREAETEESEQHGALHLIPFNQGRITLEGEEHRDPWL